MSYTNMEARQQLLDSLAAATDQLARAIASLGEAYEQLDERQAEALEQRLFRPVQHAYGVAKRTHSGFAARYDLPRREFTTPIPEAPSTGVKGYIDHAVEAVGIADTAIAGLQDSLMPVEVGDAELRAGLTQVRQLIDGFAERARELVRVFGR